MELSIRRATHDDYEAVAAFTSEIWADRGGDYLPDVYHDWLEDEDEDDRKTFLAAVESADDPEREGAVAGILQAVMLSPDEAWYQGMRVNADYRGRGVARRLNDAAIRWSRARGATVGRVMTFSWNAAALGVTRADGFEPVTEFRWAHVEPDPDAAGAPGYDSVAEPTAAWRYWTHSDARDHLRGLALDDAESWALRELTRPDLERLAEETVVVVAVRGGGAGGDGVAGGDGAGGEGAAGGDGAGGDVGSGTGDDAPATAGPSVPAATSYRTRTFERTGDDGVERTWAEYGVGAWESVPAARALFAAIARDAASIGAERTRVLIPETARYVSDAVAAGAGVSENPCFVLERGL